MDRFVFPQEGGAASSFMGAAQHPLLMTSAAATRFMFMSKPKAEKKSHSEAESRRRKRINDHLVTLRSILPSKVKTDKATLLLETVQHVKELQQKFAEVGLPSESDTVSVSRCENADDEKKNDLVVKATVCCEDRAELNRDLVRVIRSVRGNMTRTEMATVGGRTKVVMDLKLGVESSGGDQEEIGRLKRGLRAVVENRVSGHSFGVGGRLTVSNKRGRFVMSDNGGLFVGGLSS